MRRGQPDRSRARAGINGGKIVHGSYERIPKSDTHTGRFLSGIDNIETPLARRNIEEAPRLSVYGASKHNLDQVEIHIPQQRFVCLSGVSDLEKAPCSTTSFTKILAQKGLAVEEPAAVKDIDSDLPPSFWSPKPRQQTPRSTPATYTGAWDEIRKLFANTELASQGMSPGISPTTAATAVVRLAPARVRTH